MNDGNFSALTSLNVLLAFIVAVLLHSTIRCESAESGKQSVLLSFNSLHQTLNKSSEMFSLILCRTLLAVRYVYVLRIHVSHVRCCRCLYVHILQLFFRSACQSFTQAFAHHSIDRSILHIHQHSACSI